MFKLLVYVIFGLIVGGVYHDIGNSQTSIQNRNCLLIFICAAVAFSGVISVVNSFPKVLILFLLSFFRCSFPVLNYHYYFIIINMFLCFLPFNWSIWRTTLEFYYEIFVNNFIINHRKKLL